MNIPLRAAFRTSLFGSGAMLTFALAALGTQESDSPPWLVQLSQANVSTDWQREIDPGTAIAHQPPKRHTELDGTSTSRNDEQLATSPNQCKSAKNWLSSRISSQPRIKLEPIVATDSRTRELGSRNHVGAHNPNRTTLIRTVPTSQTTDPHDMLLIRMQRQIDQMAQAQQQSQDLQRETQLLQEMRSSTQLQELKRQLKKLQAGLKNRSNVTGNAEEEAKVSNKKTPCCRPCRKSQNCSQAPKSCCKPRKSCCKPAAPKCSKPSKSCSDAKKSSGDPCDKTNRCCNADPCEISELIYKSQTACYAKDHAKAIDNLGNRFSCVYNPEMMAALVYGLNDADEQVRAEAQKAFVPSRLNRTHTLCSIKKRSKLAGLFGLSDRVH